MRIQTLRIKKYNEHVFVQRCFSHRSPYMDKIYRDYEEVSMDSDYIESIFNHDGFVEWYAIRTGITLIPKGWRGNEMRFLNPNGRNSKRYCTY